MATLKVNINLHKTWRTGGKELKTYITLSSIVHASTCTLNN